MAANPKAKGKIPDDMLCTHSRIPVDAMYPAQGENIFGQVVSCFLQDQYCEVCQVTFLTFIRPRKVVFL